MAELDEFLNALKDIAPKNKVQKVAGVGNVSITKVINLDGEYRSFENFGAGIQEIKVYAVNVPLSAFIALPPDNKQQYLKYTQSHVIVYMRSAHKYFCSHCLGIIEPKHLDNHTKNCFFTKSNPPDLKRNCGICNSKCDANTCVEHFNSSGHFAKWDYLEALCGGQTPFVVMDTDGVSYTLNSKTAKGSDSIVIDLTYMRQRLFTARGIYDEVKKSGPEQLLSLMHTLFVNQSSSYDKAGIETYRRNECVKLIQYYMAQINVGHTLCHFKGSDRDFMTMANINEAMKLLAIKLSKATDSDPKTQAKREAMILDVFSTIQGTPIDCLVCKKQHGPTVYAKKAALYTLVNGIYLKIVGNPKVFANADSEAEVEDEETFYSE